MLAAALLCLLPTARAADLYVDPVAGHDVLGDGSTSSPWKTLTYAVASLPPGANVVHLLPGQLSPATGETFPIGVPAADDLEIRGSGVATSFLFANGTPTALILHPSGAPTPTGSETITLRDLTLDQVGVRCQEATFGYSVELEAVRFRNTPNTALSSSAFSGSVSVTARKCTFEGNTLAVSAYGAGGSSATISLFDCVLRDGGVGASASGLATLGGGGGSGTVILTRCLVTNNTTGTQADGNFEFGQAGEGTITLIDTLVAQNQVGFFGYDIATLSLSRSTLAGNVTGVSANGPTPSTVWVIPSGSCIWGNGFDVDPINVLFASYSNLPVGSSGTNLLHVDPQYVSPSSGDFHLLAASPLIDAGNPAEAPAVPHDLDLNPRIVDGDFDGTARVDIGYSEWNSTHLSAAGRPLLGATLTFGTTAPVGSLYALFLAFGPGALPLGAAGTVLIDRSSTVLLTTGSVPGSWSVQVPSAAGLAGLELYFQAYAFGALQATLSNRLDLVLGS